MVYMVMAVCYKKQPIRIIVDFKRVALALGHSGGLYPLPAYALQALHEFRKLLPAIIIPCVYPLHLKSYILKALCNPQEDCFIDELCTLTGSLAQDFSTALKCSWKLSPV
jgi:hypothetical protein